LSLMDLNLGLYQVQQRTSQKSFKDMNGRILQIQYWIVECKGFHLRIMTLMEDGLCMSMKPKLGILNL
jgi:hypothetical protein